MRRLPYQNKVLLLEILLVHFVADAGKFMDKQDISQNLG
jgi:hypothetical protein